MSPIAHDDAGRPTLPDARTASESAVIMALSVIVLVGAALRIARIDCVPPAINQDEAIHAYDAWCLLQTGRDHDGAAWPIFFRAFGDYHPAPFVYLLIPFQAVMGIGVWSARLPAALMGVLALPLAFLLVRKHYGAFAGLATAALLAISPWHLHVSRLALEAGICPTLILAGLVALEAAGPIRCDDRGALSARRLGWLLLSGILLGLCTWTYHAMRVFVPLLLFGIIVIYRRKILESAARPAGRFNLIVWAGGFLIGLLPFLVAWVIAPQQVWARATTVSTFDDSGGLAGIVRSMLVHYLRHFSPDFLFRRGDPSMIQSVPDFGQLYLAYLLLVPIGLWQVLRDSRADRFGRLLLWWMFIGPLPSALAYWPGGHSLRSVGSLPVYDILAAVGLCGLFSMPFGRVRRAALGLATVCTLGVAVQAGYFLHRFFVEYPIRAAAAFESEWRDVFAAAQARQAEYDFVLFTTHRSNQPGALYLFWTRMDPAACQAAQRAREPFGIVDRIVQIDRVVFQPSENLKALATEPGVSAKVLVAERPEVPVDGEVLQRFNYPDGREAMILYEVRIGKAGGASDDAAEAK